MDDKPQSHKEQRLLEELKLADKLLMCIQTLLYEDSLSGSGECVAYCITEIERQHGENIAALAHYPLDAKDEAEVQALKARMDKAIIEHPRGIMGVLEDHNAALQKAPKEAGDE